MKTLIASIVSLLLGVAIGWYCEHRHAERTMTDYTDYIKLTHQLEEALSHGYASKGILGIELVQSGNTQQLVQLFSFPIANFYTSHANLTNNDEQTKRLLAKVERVARTNQIVAALIKWEETNADGQWMWSNTALEPTPTAP